MRIRPLSDLHLEFIRSDWTPPVVDADVVVLAGDIHTGDNAMPWIKKHFPEVPVIYIMGNHEGYRHNDIHTLGQVIRKQAPPNVRFLEDQWTIIDGVNFFGGTLWTDFNLDGDMHRAMTVAERCMNDYYQIKHDGKRLTPQITRDLHQHCRDNIAKGLQFFPASEKKVVITHHLPSRLSVDPDYRSSEANPAYASNLDHVMDNVYGPDLWIHGHTHRSKDYRVGKCRVVANPKGYPMGDGRNPDFDPTLVVEV